MKVVNQKEINELQKERMSQKMRLLSNEILILLAKKGGKIGSLAAKLDSLESRYLDRNKGIYAS